MKVEQFLNRNQFHLYDDKLNVDILQSYNSKVVGITNNRGCYQCITLGRDWDYSTTTSKHLYAFLDIYLYDYLEDMNGDNIKNTLRHTNNRRKYIQKLIDNKIFLYDEEMN